MSLAYIQTNEPQKAHISIAKRTNAVFNLLINSIIRYIESMIITITKNR